MRTRHVRRIVIVCAAKYHVGMKGTATLEVCEDLVMLSRYTGELTGLLDDVHEMLSQIALTHGVTKEQVTAEFLRLMTNPLPRVMPSPLYPPDGFATEAECNRALERNGEDGHKYAKKNTKTGRWFPEHGGPDF